MARRTDFAGADRPLAHVCFKGSKEESIEKVVLEGELSDPAEVSVLRRKPNPRAAVRATKLEPDLAHRFGLIPRIPSGGGERRDSRREDEADVAAALLRRGRRGNCRRCGRDGGRPTGIIIGRLAADDRRFLSTTEHDELIALLTDGDPLGRSVRVRSFDYGNRCTLG